MPGLKEIKGMVLTSADIRAAWEALTIPIPRGVMIYEIDTEKVKIGNGVNLYSELPYRIDAVLTQEQKTMLDAVNSVNGVLQLDSTGKISTSLLPAEFQTAVADTVVAKDDAEAAAVLAIDAKTAAENARDTTVDIATGLTGAAVPVGTEFMWLADPQDPLGGIPAGYILAMGQELSRATYPDLFAFANTGGRILSEVDWQTQAAANDGNVGLYSSGDGSTTFRMPKIQCFIRSGTIDKAGSYEGDATRNITGQANIVGSVSNTDETIGSIRKYSTGVSTFGSGTTRFNTVINLDTSREVPTADENRPKTIYRSMIVKAFGATVNTGAVDVTQLATDVSTTQMNVQGLLGRSVMNFAEFALFRHETVYNVAGGSSAAGWNVRPLTHTAHNTIQGCSLSSNEVTLPAGTYWMEATGNIYNSGRLRLVVADALTAEILVIGPGDYTETSGFTTCRCSGMVTIPDSKQVVLRQSCGGGVATEGLGLAGNVVGINNIHAELFIWRIA